MHTKIVADVSRGAEGGFFRGDWGRVSGELWSLAVPKNLSLKLRSKFNHGFTNHGSLVCAAICKTLHAFKEKRAHKKRDGQFYFQNIQNEVLET